jgi:hypothetical protein
MGKLRPDPTGRLLQVLLGRLLPWQDARYGDRISSLVQSSDKWKTLRFKIGRLKSKILLILCVCVFCFVSWIFICATEMRAEFDPKSVIAPCSKLRGMESKCSDAAEMWLRCGLRAESRQNLGKIWFAEATSSIQLESEKNSNRIKIIKNTSVARNWKVVPVVLSFSDQRK